MVGSTALCQEKLRFSISDAPLHRKGTPQMVPLAYPELSDELLALLRIGFLADLLNLLRDELLEPALNRVLQTSVPRQRVRDAAQNRRRHNSCSAHYVRNGRQCSNLSRRGTTRGLVLSSLLLHKKLGGIHPISLVVMNSFCIGRK